MVWSRPQHETTVAWSSTSDVHYTQPSVLKEVIPYSDVHSCKVTSPLGHISLSAYSHYPHARFRSCTYSRLGVDIRGRNTINLGLVNSSPNTNLGVSSTREQTLHPRIRPNSRSQVPTKCRRANYGANYAQRQSESATPMSLPPLQMPAKA